MADSSPLFLRISEFLQTRKGGLAADAMAAGRLGMEQAPRSHAPAFLWEEEIETILQGTADALQRASRGESAAPPAPESKTDSGARIELLLSAAWQVRSSFTRALNRFQVEQTNTARDFTSLQMTEVKQEAVLSFERQLSAALARWITQHSAAESVPAAGVRDLHAGLRAIQGLLQIASTHLPPQARGHVAAAVQQLQRLATSAQVMTEGEAASSTSAAGITPPPPPPPVRPDLAVAPLDVGSFVRALAETARPLARKKGVRLEAMCNPGPAILRTDAARLHRAATLLIDYALHFTEQGEVSIVSGQDEQGAWVLEISDSSPGVPPQVLAKLLQGVAHAPDDAASLGDATIGIALARDLAELLGGTLHGTSEPGEGNCFRLILPLS